MTSQCPFLHPGRQTLDTFQALPTLADTNKKSQSLRKRLKSHEPTGEPSSSCQSARNAFSKCQPWGFLSEHALNPEKEVQLFMSGDFPSTVFSATMLKYSQATLRNIALAGSCGARPSAQGRGEGPVSPEPVGAAWGV